MGKTKSGRRRNSFGKAQSKRAQLYFAQINRTAAQTTTTRSDTPLPERPIAASGEVPESLLDSPTVDNFSSSSDEDLEGDKLVHDWMAQHLNRLLVSAQYSRVYGSPPKSQWRGRDGTFAHISHVFPDVSRSMIKRVVRETFHCERIGVTYKGLRKHREFAGTYLIPRNSLYERMVCDLLERGLGIHHTTLLINAELKKDGLEEVGASCVRDTYYRLCPEIIPIRKVAMGTNDAHSSWAKASFNISKQLAICFGVLDPLVILDPPMPDPLPLRDGSVAAASAATLTLPALPVTADGGTLVVNQVSTEVVSPAAADGGTSTLVINQDSTEVVDPAHGSVVEASAAQWADGVSTEVVSPAPPTCTWFSSRSFSGAMG